VFSEHPLQPEAFPLRLEAGSPNTLGLAGLRESIQFILQYGIPWIRKHELSLTERLIQGLREDPRFTVYGPPSLEDRIAVVSVRVAGCSPERVGAFLSRDHRIGVRTGLHCAPGAHRTMGTFPDGTVRISPGYFTTTTDIDACLEALKDAADRLAGVATNAVPRQRGLRKVVG
jgi:selenocysteine lyase/cysteine desulfurase